MELAQNIQECSDFFSDFTWPKAVACSLASISLAFCVWALFHYASKP